MGSEEISDGENVPACFPPWQPLAPDLTCFQETSPLSLSLPDLQDEVLLPNFLLFSCVKLLNTDEKSRQNNQSGRF